MISSTLSRISRSCMWVIYFPPREPLLFTRILEHFEGFSGENLSKSMISCCISPTREISNIILIFYSLVEIRWVGVRGVTFCCRCHWWGYQQCCLLIFSPPSFICTSIRKCPSKTGWVRSHPRFCWGPLHQSHNPKVRGIWWFWL